MTKLCRLAWSLSYKNQSGISMYTLALAMALPLSLVGLPLIFSLFTVPIFFLLFRHMEQTGQKPAISRTIKILMRVAITVVALWFAAKLFSATIQGGGASYVVSSYAIITLIPAVVLLLLLDIIVIFRSYGPKIGYTVLALVAVAGALRIASPYWKDYLHEKQWHGYCEEAKDEFNIGGEQIGKLEFYNFVANNKYTAERDGQFRRCRSCAIEYLGLELVKRGIINEFEVMAKGNPKHYSSIVVNNKEVKTPINEIGATHRVSSETKNYSNDPSSRRWFTKQTISISNLKTGKIVAQRVQFIDPFKGDRSCAQVYNNQISAVDFLENAIEKSSN
jgi:hypothetical protein